MGSGVCREKCIEGETRGLIAPSKDHYDVMVDPLPIRTNRSRKIFSPGINSEPVFAGLAKDEDGLKLPGFTRKETEKTGTGEINSPMDRSFRYKSNCDSMIHSERVRSPNSMTTLEKVLGTNVLQNFLQKTEKMNEIAPSIKIYVQALPDYTPSKIMKIPELENRYDPTIKATGPYLEPQTGVTYFGQVKDSIADGWGKVVTKNGDYLEGFFVEGVLDVYCRQLSKGGRYYEGGLKNSRRHGKGYVVDSAHIRIECLWDRGIPTGPTKIFDKNNVLLFEGESQEGQLSGQNCYYKDKVRNFEYRGNFSQGKINGKGTKWFSNGDTYEGDFVDGIEHGSGILTFADGSKFIGQFLNGKPQSEVTNMQ